MKVNMDKIRVVRFAVFNRLRGYKLLRNPKCTSPYDVAMIKSRFGIQVQNNNIDKIFYVNRLHLKKEKEGFVKEKTTLMATYFMNPETKDYSNNRKSIMLYSFKNGDFRHKEKTSVSQEMLEQRKQPDWSYKEEIDDCTDDLFWRNTHHVNQHDDSFLRRNNNGYYRKKPPFITRIITLGMWKRILGEDPSQPFESGFFETLIANLKR